MIKKINIIISIMIAIICVSNTAFAAFSGKDIINKGDSFLADGSISNTISEGAVIEFSTGFNAILLGLGVMIVLIGGAMLGIQFMVESAEGKAKIMDKLLPFLIGTIIIFAATYIWSQFIAVAESVT